MINVAVLTGRLTNFPELKKTKNDVSVTQFNVAVDRCFNNSEGKKITDFITCVAWRETADFICKYFKKGEMIALMGEIQTRKYEDKNGNKRTAFEIVINYATFCGGKGDNSGADAQRSGCFPAPFTVIDETDIDEDLPF